MDCPKCKSLGFVKNGIVSGRQRYKCKDCSNNYTAEKKSDLKSEDTRRLALSMYLKGLGFRSMDIVYCCTDYWKSYREFVPANIHIQTKAETYTVESYNGRIRHYLAKFRRKSKCYSKAKQMINKSLNLLFLKLNNNLAILI